MKSMTLFAAATASAAALFGAPTAAADDVTDTPTVTPIGGQAQLVNGPVTQAWTVYQLQPSMDVIGYQPQGTLWEAIATDQAVAGSATPIVSDFNARAANGENYRALFQVPTAMGVNPATLAQGQDVSGKIYFDVTGAEPDSVVYNAFGQDLIVWEQPADEIIIEEIDVSEDGDQITINEDEAIIDGDQVVVEGSETTVEGN